MTDETKKLFDAPWKRAQNLSRNGSGKTRGFSPSRIVDASNNNVAYAYPTMPKGKQKITANRLARLPELYDALMELVKKYCKLADLNCPNENHCLLDEEHKDMCEVMPYLELLKKVRDGE